VKQVLFITHMCTCTNACAIHLYVQESIHGVEDEGESCDYELSDESVEESENDEAHEAK